MRHDEHLPVNGKERFWVNVRGWESGATELGCDGAVCPLGDCCQSSLIRDNPERPTRTG